MIDDCVAQNLIEPGRQLFFVTHLIRGAERLDQAVLQKIISIGLAAETRNEKGPELRLSRKYRIEIGGQ